MLWLLGPLDWAWRKATGRGSQPPLWLRRHVGPPGRFESAAAETAEMVDRWGLVRDGDLVVDLGCGCGAMAPALGERMGETGRYVGIDVHRPSIRWCRRRFAGDPRFRFEGVAAEDASGPPGFAGGYRLPVEDGAAGFVLAKSLFTHLLEEETTAYLAEIRRVLAPGRRALVTAFLFDGSPGGPRAAPPAFPYPPGSGVPVRWLRATRPRAAVAYEWRHFLELLAGAGLEISSFVHGFYPGTDRRPRGQDVLVVERPGGGTLAGYG